MYVVGWAIGFSTLEFELLLRFLLALSACSAAFREYDSGSSA